MIDECASQTTAICWIFGAKKFYACIEQMVGYKVTGKKQICREA